MGNNNSSLKDKKMNKKLKVIIILSAFTLCALFIYGNIILYTNTVKEYPIYLKNFESGWLFRTGPMSFWEFYEESCRNIYEPIFIMLGGSVV